MSIVQFGTASVKGAVDSRNRVVLSAAFVTGLSLSTVSIPFKGYPMALYDAGQGRYAIGVVVEPSVDATTATSPTLTWRGTTFVLGKKGQNQFLRINLANSETPSSNKSVIFRGMPVVVSDEQSFVLVDGNVAGDPHDEEVTVLLNTNTVTLRRFGKLWYLVVCE